MDAKRAIPATGCGRRREPKIAKTACLLTGTGQHFMNTVLHQCLTSERRRQYMKTLNIGIVGGGVGGLAAAVALRAVGHEVCVFEQASRYGRVGADVNMTPNAVKVADGLGI